MASSGDSISWLDILGSVSSTIAIIIFITGRESLAELLGWRKPDAQRTKRTLKNRKSKLSRSLNKPGALLVGLVFTMIAIGSFLMPSPSSAPSIINNYDNSITNVTPTNEAATSPKEKSAPTSSNKTIPLAKPMVTPLKGIEILNADNSVNAVASRDLSELLIHRVNSSDLPVIQGRLLAYTQIIDSTATTHILSYKVSLSLKVYKQDGIHLCKTRFFETTIYADEMAAMEKIKQQAMLAFTRELDEKPAAITCH